MRGRVAARASSSQSRTSTESSEVEQDGKRDQRLGRRAQTGDREHLPQPCGRAEPLELRSQRLRRQRQSLPAPRRVHGAPPRPRPAAAGTSAGAISAAMVSTGDGQAEVGAPGQIGPLPQQRRARGSAGLSASHRATIRAGKAGQRRRQLAAARHLSLLARLLPSPRGCLFGLVVVCHGFSAPGAASARRRGPRD